MTQSWHRPDPGPAARPPHPPIPPPRSGEKDLTELADPYDLPFPEDRWPSGRPEHVIVVDQLRGWQPAQPPSLAELLETRRTREPQPDPEAEP